MIRRRAVTALVLGASAIALAVSGCGSTSGSDSSSNDAMPGGQMSHSMGASGATMSGAMDHGSMSSNGGENSTSAMIPLVAGADGTSARSGNLRLAVDPTSLQAGKPTKVTLTVTDVATGKPVKKFEVDQTKLMHLVVVNRDLSGFQHLHPAFHSDGRFTVMLNLPAAGTYRAISDFTTGGKRYALGVNLEVPGKAKTTPLPAPTTSAMVDGYIVKFSHGELSANKDASLEFAVSREGQPETGLQPYLGALGHLVALRSPDVSYTHVHPVESARKRGTVTFDADFQKAGKYRLYFQFRAGGAVHVAPFTIVVK